MLFCFCKNTWINLILQLNSTKTLINVEKKTIKKLIFVFTVHNKRLCHSYTHKGNMLYFVKPSKGYGL